MTSDTINDATMANMTVKYGMSSGAITSVIGWLSSSQAVLLIGVIVTLLGFIMNLIFQIRRDNRQAKQLTLEAEYMKKDDDRKQALFEEQMKQLQEKHNGEC